MWPSADSKAGSGHRKGYLRQQDVCFHIKSFDHQGTLEQPIESQKQSVNLFNEQRSFTDNKSSENESHQKQFDTLASLTVTMKNTIKQEA